ncbi:unnamed protein product [Orchesella dallaii]|uniref:Gustatory receptor n=1 Tax=Orchesella dallaii TaxID=48710 RepID=A0ABP1RPH1_9HEXA
MFKKFLPKFIKYPYDYKATFIKFCEAGTSLESYPLGWNHMQNKLEVFDTRKLLKVCSFRMKLHTIATTLIAIQTFHEIWNGFSDSTQFQVVSQLESALLLLILFSNNFYLQLVNKYGSEIVLYVNCLFPSINTRKSEETSNSNPSFIETCNVLFTWGIYMSAKSFPGFAVGLRLFDTCRGSIAGYWILPECHLSSSSFHANSNWTLNMAVKFVIFSINYVLWEFGMRAGFCYLWTSNFVINREQKDTRNIGEIYRKIQVLAILNNAILKTAVLIFLVFPVFLLAISIAVLVKLDWNSDNVFVIVLFISMICDTIPELLICVGGAVGTYTESKTFLTKLGVSNSDTNLYKGAEFRWLQRFRKSCPPIKIQFGPDNFLEELTPLNCLNSAVNLTMQLLLLQ